MIARIVLSAVIAGLVAGLFVSALQAVATTPLILQAETFENAAPPADAHGHAQDHPSAGAWQRHGFTLLANVLMATAFALLLASAFTLRARAVTPARSLGWGLAGFAAFSFIPAIGLPPELPGMAAGDLAARQAWWWSSALANCAGLALLAFARPLAAKALGAAAIAAPLIIGAPHPPPGAAAGGVPPELAARFVTASQGTALLFWLVLAAVAAYAFARLSPAGASEARKTGTA